MLLAHRLPSAEIVFRQQKQTEGTGMIELTNSAVNAVRTAIARAEGHVEGLRIRVQSGGCAGLQYVMGLVPQAAPEDIILERNGVKLFVDRASVPRLNGTTIDFIVGLEESGFSFDNPNAVNRCSCGRSFG
jgi:iron-sulfur cluster assembly accessory protein